MKTGATRIVESEYGMFKLVSMPGGQLHLYQQDADDGWSRLAVFLRSQMSGADDAERFMQAISRQKPKKKPRDTLDTLLG
jgi:hypothetical protein